MTTALANTSAQGSPAFMLDVYAQGGQVAVPPRMDALATISAGERAKGQGNSPGLPTVSRDGRIILHDPDGVAPGLQAMLEQTDFKSLVISFPYDDIPSFMHQSFERWNSTALEAHGDEKQITVIVPGKTKNDEPQHISYPAGTEQYEFQKSTCKVSVSVFFHLAAWEINGPRVIFPDGYGFYRLRFTSRNSLRGLFGNIAALKNLTGGRIAGMPLELSIFYRSVAGPDGSKRRIPIWRALFNPPAAMSLDSSKFRQLAEQSLAQGAALQLAPPPRETMALAAASGPMVDLDEADVDLLAKGGACDEAHWRAYWFAAVENTIFDSDDARHAFIEKYTAGKFNSLAKYLATASEDEASALIETVKTLIQADAEEQRFAAQQASSAQRTAMPDADELESDGHTAAEWAAAGDEYDRVVAEGESLGVRLKPVAKSALTYERILKRTDLLRSGISEARAKNAADQDVIDEQSAEPSHAADPVAPEGTKKSAFAERAAAAVKSTAEDKAEADELFGGNSLPELPEHLKPLVLLAEDRLIDIKKPEERAYLLGVVNEWRLHAGQPAFEMLEKMDADAVTTFVRAVKNKAHKLTAPENLE